MGNHDFFGEAKSVAQDYAKRRLWLWVISLVGVPMIIISCVLMVFVFASVAGGGGTVSGYVSGDLRSFSPFAESDIPEQYWNDFIKAQEDYGVSWAILAGIAKNHSDFGRCPKYRAGNGVKNGKLGFMGFNPLVWSGDNNPHASGGDLPKWDTDPDRIAEHGGYGTDGDFDGVADPSCPADAIAATARLLKDLGFDNDVENALYSFTQDWSLVRKVTGTAEKYTMVMIPTGSAMWPVPPEHTTISSRFGMRWGRPHNGIDLAVPTGTPVLAVAPGRVTRNDWFGGYGNCVDLQHANGVMTRYAHLDKIGVVGAQQVVAGQVIGLSGNTGRSTGPHLHFEVQINGRPVNPEDWLKAPTIPGGNY